MTRAILITASLCLVLTLNACGDDDGPPSMDQDPFATPKGSISRQLDLLKAGDVEALRACFTERQQGRITADVVTAAQAEAAKMTIDDLFESVEGASDKSGNKTATVKMANGRTLTTLVLLDGKWVSDTVWFR